MSGRVGPYELVREVAEAPGVTLAEARDSDGGRRLLQLARFRGAASETERIDRQRHERLVAQRTAELISDADLVVHAHGGSDLAEGERILFWALPWSDTPFLGDRLRERPLSAQELARIGVTLAERMALRHTWGRVDPLLSEHIIRVSASGKAEVVGVPIALDPGWLSPAMKPARIASEERATEDRRPSGDVWRLGMLLLALAEHTESVTSDMRDCFEALAAEDVSRRVPTARRALELLERIVETARAPAGLTPPMTTPRSPGFAPQDAGAPLLRREPTSGQTAVPISSGGASVVRPDQAVPLAWNEWESTPGVHWGAEARLPDPFSMSSWEISPTLANAITAVHAATDVDLEAITRRARAFLLDSTLENHPDSEAVTRQSEPQTPVPKADASILVDRTDDALSLAASTGGAHAYEAIPAPDTIVEPALVPDVDAHDEPSDKKANGHAHPSVASIDPIAASWQQPVLPSGESPWSEVVHPRGTHNRVRSDFPGFSDEIPVPARPEKRAQAYDTTEYASGSSFTNIPTSEIEIEIAAALRGFNTRKIISSVLVLLVIFGLFALMSRTAARRTDSKPAGFLVTPANEVTLESDPPGATVVSETDGALLGKTPVHFLVAPGAAASVYLVAPDREPLRLALPDRGGLTAKLAPLGGTTCAVKLSASEEIDLEGVLASIGNGSTRTIPGAAVVRAKAGEPLRGARLVLCPSLGGQAEQQLALERKGTPVAVRVTQPEGATAYLNGDPIGTVPAIGQSEVAFSRVRIDDPQGLSEERYVSTLTETEIRMPPPRHRPVPLIVSPDSSPAAALDLEADAKAIAPTATADEPRVDADVSSGKTESDDEAKTSESSSAVKPKLTKAQKSSRTRRLLKTGAKHLRSGRIQAAKDSLVECVEIDPTAAECHKELGSLYWRSRSTQKARDHFLRYLELEPQSSDADRIRRMLEQ